MHFHRTHLVIVLTILFQVAQAQDITFYKAAQIDQWKNADTDTIFVINFWATWCGPCVTELPEFEKIQALYADQKVKVILVSTDFKKELEGRVKSFMLEKNLHCQVAYMDETNPNNWIDLVHSDWSGLIPATLIVNHRKNFEYFFEGQLDFETLEMAVKEAL